MLPLFIYPPAPLVISTLKPLQTEMNITTIKRQLFYRYALSKMNFQFTEMENNILIAIFLMTASAQRCSSQTLILFLSKIRHTPNKQIFLRTIKKLIEKDFIKKFGDKAGTNMYLSTAGRLYIYDLEKEMRN